MPADPYSRDNDDEDKPKKDAGGRRKDFDCPVCNANNPVDDGFVHESEVRCFYCGLEFRVVWPEGGKPKFKEI